MSRSLIYQVFEVDERRPFSFSYTNTTVDDTSRSFSFSPSSWTKMDAQGAVGSAANQSLTTAFSDVSRFLNHSVSVSTAQGSSANITFQGELYE